VDLELRRVVPATLVFTTSSSSSGAYWGSFPESTARQQVCNLGNNCENLEYFSVRREQRCGGLSPKRVYFFSRSS
jgi:hypothetical protein